jgi:hypothetical protein
LKSNLEIIYRNCESPVFYYNIRPLNEHPESEQFRKNPL